MRSCEPGEVVGCYEGGYQLAVCNEQGTGTDPRPCEGGLRCRDGECSDRVCDEGERRCNGETLVTVCNADGTDFVEQEECPAGTGCDEGECKSLCELNSKVTSYLGCDYWVVDLDNIDDQSAGDPPSAITVSNPNPSLSAEVTVTQVDGSPVMSFMVEPNGLEVRELPTGQDLEGSGIYRNNAFHVETSLPVTMHQFNPLNGEGVFTNDASLLLPVNAGGREYLVMAWKHRGNALESLSGYATVVALEEGETRVTVTPTAAVAAGSGVPGLRANTPWEAVLQRGEVLSMNTSGPEGADLTGTSILADRNIAVFGGHQCANIPTPSTNYCDHAARPAELVGDGAHRDALQPAQRPPARHLGLAQRRGEQPDHDQSPYAARPRPLDAAWSERVVPDEPALRADQHGPRHVGAIHAWVQLRGLLARQPLWGWV
jgi:hypothetical protein